MQKHISSPSLSLPNREHSFYVLGGKGEEVCEAENVSTVWLKT